MTNVQYLSPRVNEQEVPMYITLFLWAIVVPTLVFFVEISQPTAWVGYGIYCVALIIMHNFNEKRPSAMVTWIFWLVVIVGPGFVWTMARSPEKFFPMLA